MEYIAAFDIGTTAIKGALVTHDWQIAHTESLEIETIFSDGFIEQSPKQWYERFCLIANIFTSQVGPDKITGIVMSGQMQDLILMDKSGDPLQNAILYSDARAGSQVERIDGLLEIATVESITGNPLDGSIPFAKLLWIKENSPEILSQTHKIGISSKDFVLARLCGEFVTDVTSASTSGLMDLSLKQWRTDWLEIFGISPKVLPRLCTAQEEVGRLHQRAAAETGFAAGTPVYAGTGDAGATTLASGISKPGECNINLGTSGWVATVSKNVLSQKGVFNLAAMPADLLVNVVPFINAGNVHKWICSTLAPDNMQDAKYIYGTALLEESSPGSHGLFCLPYLAGERFPVVNPTIKGAFVGLTIETTKQDIIRAALEGVAYSIRNGLDSLEVTPLSVSLIGGGARSSAWCQMLADILNSSIKVYRDAEFAPILAIAASALISQNIISSYYDFIDLRKSDCTVYHPFEQNVKYYQCAYREYLQLYPAIKSFFG